MSSPSRNDPVAGRPVSSPATGEDWRAFDAEAQLLARSLRAERLTVLVGRAGVGKSTLLTTGLLPLLRRRAGDGTPAGGAQTGVQTLPERRGRGPGRGELRYFVDRWSDASLDELVRSLDETPEAAPARLDLVEALSPVHLSALSRRRGGAHLLFVFDHFEWLVDDAPRSPGLQQFADAWAALLQAPDLDAHFLVAVDEQAWPGLQELLARVPRSRAQAFRLQARPGRQALQALTDPRHGDRAARLDASAAAFAASLNAIVSQVARSARPAYPPARDFAASVDAMLSRVANAAGLDDASVPRDRDASAQAEARQTAAPEDAARNAAEAARIAQMQRDAEAVAKAARAEQRAESERRAEAERQAEAARRAEAEQRAANQRLAQALAVAEAAAAREVQARQAAEAAATAAQAEQRAESERRAAAERDAEAARQAEAVQRAETQRLAQALAVAEAAAREVQARQAAEAAAMAAQAEPHADSEHVAQALAVAEATAVRAGEVQRSIEARLPVQEEPPPAEAAAVRADEARRAVEAQPEVQEEPPAADAAASLPEPQAAAAGADLPAPAAAHTRPVRSRLRWVVALAAMAAAVLWWATRPAPTEPTAEVAPESAAPGAEAAPAAGTRFEMVAAGADGTHARMARELAAALSTEAAALRVVTAAEGSDPIAALRTPGRLAIARFDTLRTAHAGAQPPLRVLAPLFVEELVFVVRDDSPLKHIYELNGRRVGIGTAGGDAARAVRETYRRMFGAEMAEPAQFASDQALAELVAFRSIDAMAIIESQARAWWAALDPRAARRLRLLTLDPLQAGDRHLMQALGTSVVRTGVVNDQRALTPAVVSYLVASGVDDGDTARLTAMARTLCRELPRLRASGHPKWRELQPTAQPDTGWPLVQPFQAVLSNCVRQQG